MAVMAMSEYFGGIQVNKNTGNNVTQCQQQERRVSNFSWALDALKRGCKLSREGWNGAGQWIARWTPPPPNSIVALPMGVGRDETAFFTTLPTKPFLYINTVQGDRVPWFASQTDILADDWYVVEF